MKTATLLPLLSLLLTSTGTLGLTEHPNAEALARRINPRRHHAHEVERMIENIKKREASEGVAVQKRQVRTRGQTCRPRNQQKAVVGGSSSSSAASSAATTQAAATTAAPTAAAPPASSAAAPTSASGGNSGGSTNNGANWGQLTPNGKKAGMSAGDSVGSMASHLGWYYNWAPSDPWQSHNGVAFVPTLWGGGTTDGVDASRLAEFRGMNAVPTWIVGPNEPDCAAGGGMSAGMTIDATAALWNELMAPKGHAGSLLLSPSMCHQLAENGWLADFQTKISRDWDITNVHINKNNMAGVRASIDYYYNKYKKPLWVTEFACVDDSTAFIPCTDQGQINQFINEIVDVLQNDDRVYAYAYSNGYGLGHVWPAWNNGQLSESGRTYMNAISKYY